CRDLQPGNLVALEREAVPQLYRTAGEIAGDPCDDNSVGAGDIDPERLACIVIFRRGLDLPTRDGVSTSMLPMLIGDDSILDETPSRGVGVSGICREVRGDRRWQLDGCVCLRSYRSTKHRDAMKRKNARKSEELTCE